MIPQKCVYFLNRFLQIGPVMASKLLIHRVQKRHFTNAWRKQWYKGFIYHTWQDLAFMHNVESFENFFNQLIERDFCYGIISDREFVKSLPQQLHDPETIRLLADQAASLEVTILGYGTFRLNNNAIPWHTDFTTNQQSPQSWKQSFYADITIPQHPSSGTRQPDIKVPWELSRLQHFFHLGLGYRQAVQASDHERAQRYSDAFVHQANDWIINNRFLHGVNWLNPMEVAIRAINFIWAFHFFKQSSSISIAFWQQLICVLYDHMIYLERSWELSDKPNNHLLADLIGHLYLCSLFIDIKNIYRTRQKTLKKLQAQWSHQILPDGTSYEGSTNYHRLVTEMMLHYILLCRHTNMPLPSQIQQQYSQMKQFLIDCSDQQNNLAQIGDNDSGRIVASFTTQPDNHNRIVTYPWFGISVIKHSNWHATLRHATYHKSQPSGHFHHDQLSITLSINGIPVIVDPGTYVYTPHPRWRNALRSAEYHNGFYLQNYTESYADLFQLARKEEPAAFDDELNVFQNPARILQDALRAPQGERVLSCARGEERACKASVWNHASHNHYQQQGLRAHRTVAFKPHDNKLTITDWWFGGSANSKWMFHLADGIIAEKKDCKTWIIKTNTQDLAQIKTELRLQMIRTHLSPAYGSLVSGTALTASQLIRSDEQIQTHFYKIAP